MAQDLQIYSLYAWKMRAYSLWLAILSSQALCFAAHDQAYEDGEDLCGSMMEPQSVATSVDADQFTSSNEIRQIVESICEEGLRLPGSPRHLKVVDYIERQLRSIPGLQLNKSDFELANWQPVDNSMYKSAKLRIDGQKVDIAAAIAYSLPTNGTASSGMYLSFHMPGLTH